MDDDEPKAVPPPDAPASQEGPIGRAKDFLTGHVLVVAILVGLAVAVALFWAVRARPIALTAAPAATRSAVSGPLGDASASAGTPSGTAASGAPSAAPTPTILVHVLGAVRHAGVVRLPQGARVQDAIEAAGGLTGKARPGTLNLAQVLADGEQVLIGSTSGPGSTVSGAGGTVPQPAGSQTAGSGIPAGGRLDLNTATQAQLEELPGVGPVTARAILDWRSRHGRFTHVEQLQEIDGIGPKTFARIEPYVGV